MGAVTVALDHFSSRYSSVGASALNAEYVCVCVCVCVWEGVVLENAPQVNKRQPFGNEPRSTSRYRSGEEICPARLDATVLGLLQ